MKHFTHDTVWMVGSQLTASTRLPALPWDSESWLGRRGTVSDTGREALRLVPEASGAGLAPRLFPLLSLYLRARE